MGLLRSLAAVGRLDRGRRRYCCGFIGGPGASPAPPSQRARLAQRQRHSAAAGRRAGLSRRSEKIRLAQAGPLFGRRKTGGAYRQLGHENAGAVRLRAAELLADRPAVRRRLRFNTETGPGPAPPPLESLKEMLPANHLWPIDDVWNFHACG